MISVCYLFWTVCARWFVLECGTLESQIKREEKKEDMRTHVESKDAGKGRRGVVTVIESERAPGTTAEVNPSILDIEPTQVSPPQQ